MLRALLLLVMALVLLCGGESVQVELHLKSLDEFISVVVPAVGAAYKENNSPLALRPLIATSPSGPVCTEAGILADAPAIVTEASVYSSISDSPPAYYIPSLQCFGSGAAWSNASNLWNDVLLCGSHTPSSACTPPLQPPDVDVFNFPAIHRYASVRDFTQQLSRNARFLAALDQRLFDQSVSLESSINPTLLLAAHAPIHADFTDAWTTFVALTTSLHSLVSPRPTAADLDALQQQFNAIDSHLLSPTIAAVVFAQLHSKVATLQLQGLTLSTALADLTHVTSLSSLSSIAIEAINIAASYAEGARNLTEILQTTDDDAALTALHDLLSSVLQFSASTLWLSVHVHASLIASSLERLNAPICGRNDSIASTPAVCTLFSFAALDVELERIRQHLYPLYSSLMLTATTLSRLGEPFNCWREALVRFSAPLLTLFQHLPRPLSIPFDIGFCKVAWHRQSSISFEGWISANASCNLTSTLLRCTNIDASPLSSVTYSTNTFSSSDFHLHLSSSSLSAPTSKKRLFSRSSSAPSSHHRGDKRQACSVSCNAGEYCPDATTCVVVPAGYWAAPNSMTLSDCTNAPADAAYQPAQSTSLCAFYCTQPGRSLHPLVAGPLIFNSSSLACLDAPLGYWSAGNASGLAPCMSLTSDALSSPLLGYSTTGAITPDCAVGFAYQAVGNYEPSLLKKLLPNDDGFVVELWVNSDNISTSFGLVGVARHWTLELIVDNTAVLRFTVVLSGRYYDSVPFVLSNGSFVHLSCSLVTNQLRFHVNGDLLSEVAWDEPLWPLSSLPHAALFIGGAGNDIPPFSGLINEIRIYSSSTPYLRSGAHLGAPSVAAYCDPFTSTLCNGTCISQCTAGQQLSAASCTCSCPLHTELCGGVCVPQCPSSFVRDSLCRCDCSPGEVALWQFSALTIASPVLSNDASNYYPDNALLSLGLTEVEFFDQQGDAILPIACIESSTAPGHSCAQLFDGMKSNNETHMWRSADGGGYAWVSLQFASVVNVSRIVVYNWNNVSSSPNLGMARVQLYAATPLELFSAPLLAAPFTSLTPLDGSISDLTDANAYSWRDRDDATISSPVVCTPCALDCSASTSQSPRSAVVRDCMCTPGYSRYGAGERCVPLLSPPSIVPQLTSYDVEASLRLVSDFSSAQLLYTILNGDGSTVLLPWRSSDDSPIRLSCVDDEATCQYEIQVRAEYKSWATSPISSFNVFINASLDRFPPHISGVINHGAAMAQVSIERPVFDARVVCRFTADGSQVTYTSLPYVAPFIVSGRETHLIRAKCFYSAGTVQLQSPETRASFIILLPASPVSIFPPSGTFPSLSVLLNSSYGASSLFYTLDGSDPTLPTSNRFIFNSSITIEASSSRRQVTLKAANAPQGFGPSAVNTAFYTILPTADPPLLHPPSGNFRTLVSGQVTCSTPGSAPYVQVNSSIAPTLSSPVLLSPFAFHLPTHLEDTTVAIAVRCIRNGFEPSALVTREYFISNYSLPNDPSASPLPDEYLVDEALHVSFSCSEPQCQIYWSSSVERPSNITGTLYSTPIILRPGSHALSAVSFVSTFDRPSRSLAPFIYRVIGKLLPPPLLNPPPTTFIGSLLFSLASPIADTQLYYALFPVDAVVDVTTIHWQRYSTPLVISSSTLVYVIQDHRYFTADFSIYNATYSLLLPPPASPSRSTWWRFLLLSLGLVALALLIGAAAFYWWRARKQAAKEQLIHQVLPSLGLVLEPRSTVEIDASAATDSSEQV